MSIVNSKYYKEALEQYNDIIRDDDPDQWDERIVNTGCYMENLVLQLCHADTNDWRNCLLEMDLFRKCWLKNGKPQAKENGKEDI